MTKIQTIKRQLLIGGIIVTIILLLAITFIAKGRVTDLAGRQQPAGVKPLVEIEAVSRRDMVKQVTLSGLTVSGAQVDLAVKYTGRIERVLVELGQPVTAGQAIIIQDSQDVELAIAREAAAVRQANAEIIETGAAYAANYQKAEADLRRTADNYQRYKMLYDSGAISLEQLDSTRQQMVNAEASFAALNRQAVPEGGSATMEIKRAALAKTEFSLQALERQRQDMTLVAPRDGIIGYRQVEVGMLAQAGQKLLTIVDNNNVYVDCQVAEEDIAQLHNGMELQVHIESLGAIYPGQIAYISPASDSKTHAFTVRLQLKQSADSLKGGMFARAVLDVPLRLQALSVPKEALLERNNKQYVFVINKDKQAEQRLVQTGLYSDGKVEILAGLTAGEQVVVSNLARMKPNVAVEIASGGKE